jgi:hypothetical protein
LHGLLHGLPFLPGDLFSDGLGGAFHSLGGDFQTGQQLHLLAAMIKGSVLAHQRCHTSHPGRQFAIFHVQFEVGGKLSSMTMSAQEVGTLDADPAQNGQHRFRA